MTNIPTAQEHSIPNTPKLQPCSGRYVKRKIPTSRGAAAAVVDSTSVQTAAAVSTPAREDHGSEEQVSI